MKKIIYLFIVVLSLALSSCATTRNAQQSQQKQEKIAILKYEMARNIILHKDYSRLPDAFRYLNQAIKVFPNDPKMYYMMALAYQMRNDKKEYVIYLNKAIEKDKKFFDAYNALGIYDFEEGFYSRALDMFTRLIKNPLYMHPDVAFFNRSRVYLKLGKLKAAQNDIESALMFSNYKNTVYWRSLISVELMQKHYLRALTSLYKMEQYIGPSYYIDYMKALCYVKLSMFDKAREQLDKIKNDDATYYTLKLKLLKEINDSNPNN